MQPQLMLFDEPTSALDPALVGEVLQVMKTLAAEGMTVLVSTHYMDEAERVAQRIAVIDHGKIIAQGSPDELKQQTSTDSLEAAFLELTGSSIRDEKAGAADQMRQMAKMWNKR